MKHVIPLPYGTRTLAYDAAKKEAVPGSLALALVYTDAETVRPVTVLTIDGEEDFMFDGSALVKRGGIVGLSNLDGGVEDFRNDTREPGPKVVGKRIEEEELEYQRANPQQAES